MVNEIKPNRSRTRGRRWMAIRERVLRLTPHCVECYKKGTVRPAQEVDHIIPLYRDGTDEPSNLQALCEACHQVKTAKDMGYKIKPEIGVDGWAIEG
jgi:5-methylcytosine-specific restriction protein A